MKMSTTVAGRLYTADEFLTLPDRDQYELLDGHLVERPMGAKAGLIIANLLGLLKPFVAGHKLGSVFSSDTGYIMFPERPNRVKFPDASFMRRGRLPNGEVPEGHFKLVPDVVVEVVSPNDAACAVQEKIEEYLEAKVELVWVVYPRARVVLAFRPDGSVQRFAATDPLRADDLFPGFTCQTEELFAVV
jgi:Uma2 family endonuclease